MKKDYHCCATCQHIHITRDEERIDIRCRRLGYETKTHYKFHCWEPRGDIKLRIESQNKNTH